MNEDLGYNKRKAEFWKKRESEVIILSDFLGSQLNKLHGVNYSDSYWLRLLRGYCVFCVNNKKDFSQGLYNTIVPLTTINKWSPITKKDSIKKTLVTILRLLRKRGSFKKVKDIFGDTNNLVLGARAKTIAKYVDNAQIIKIPGIVPLLKDKRKRIELIQIIEGSTEDSFKKNAALNLPRVFVEYFTELNRRIPKINRLKNKVIHCEHVSGFVEEFFVARCREDGAKVYEYQLGGHTGETEMSLHESRYMTIDKRRTYGWKTQEKDEPFYALRLEEFRDKYLAVNPLIDRDITIIYNRVGLDQKSYYKSFSEFISSNIDNSKYPRIHLRPRAYTKFIGNTKELAFLSHIDNFIIDTGREKIEKIVRDSRLILLANVPSTNLLECVYVDHPVVGILTNVNPSCIVIEHYNFLIEVGVLHRTVESLIMHLNDINLELWWNGVRSTDEYQEFKKTFAREVPRS